ncbi:hypothetical protein ABT364_05655 [Massilia sp. SR12]
MKFGKIVLDEVHETARAWCWRDDWYVLYDSSYSLLSKFALLNSVLAREIVDIVVSRRSRKRSAMVSNPDMDLRDGKIVDFDVLKALFRLPEQSLRDAFLLDYIPNSLPRSSPTLRWCSHCLARGYHMPLFQMNLTRVCPIHEIALCDACPECHRSISYRLRSDVFHDPFRCPHCKFDLAPLLRNARPGIMQLRQHDKTRLSLMRRFYSTEDQAICRVHELADQYKQSGMSELALSKPHSHELDSRYAGFISQVLRDLGVSSDTKQQTFALESIDCHRCNSGRNILLDDDDPYAPQETPTLNAGGRPRSVRHGDNGTFGELSVLYKAIRRHLWRHEIFPHRYCVSRAAGHLWWNVEGERMSVFCPDALAFMRWRMMWEGCGTPRYLLSAPQHDAFGILGWLLARPCPCPPHWSNPTKQWVIKQIFAGTCLKSYRDLKMHAGDEFKQGETLWSRNREAVQCECLWAVAGGDSIESPATVYLQYGKATKPDPINLADLSLHRMRLKEQLNLIMR